MKHKASELEGALLDAAVARAEGFEPRDYAFGSCWYCPAPERGLIPFDPSTSWSLAGPIIERERIAVMHLAGEWRGSIPDAMGYAPKVFRADSPLIAAMRAYVASRFGEEVELP